MNDTTLHDPEVLVVGAGPTGLVAAVQLAERGVSVRIIDATPVRSDKSRALGVQARTLELLDKMGLAERLIAQGERTGAINFHVEGRHTAHLPLGELDVDHTPFPYLLFVSQVKTERVLEERLNELGVQVERPVQLLDLRQDEHRVSARVRHDGQEQIITARYLIGADGAHSTVRHALELPFHGDAYDSEFILGDVEATGDLAFDELHMFVARKGVVVIFPLTRTTVRVMATGFPVARDDELTLAELQEQTTLLSGRPDLRLTRPTWLSRFRLHHRGVDRYRVGRVFIAGDAAHIHSPAGGQGMNTGIQDSYNLAWKLAMVLQGQATDTLLDSYHAERYPVGQRLLGFTDRLFSVMSTLGPITARLRNWLTPILLPRVFDARGSRIFAFASQIGIRYRRSPVVAEVSDGTDARFSRGARAGDRAPGAPLPQGRFLSHLRGSGWWLLGFCGEGDAATDAERLRTRLQAVCADAPWIQPLMISSTPRPETEGWVLDHEGMLHERYGLTGPGLVLVRPDGHIAFRSAGPGVDALWAWLDAQRPTRPSASAVRALPSADARSEVARAG
ncbi:MAG: FAD-dependent monooxygenase [Myxococcota bacterium]